MVTSPLTNTSSSSLLKFIENRFNVIFEMKWDWNVCCSDTFEYPRGISSTFLRQNAFIHHWVENLMMTNIKQSTRRSIIISNQKRNKMMNDSTSFIENQKQILMLNLTFYLVFCRFLPIFSAVLISIFCHKAVERLKYQFKFKFQL